MTTDIKEITDLVQLRINLMTIQTVLSNCNDFPYVRNIVDAADTALLAVDSKLQLYFDSLSK